MEQYFGGNIILDEPVSMKYWTSRSNSLGSIHIASWDYWQINYTE
jgi:hypothetical protein